MNDLRECVLHFLADLSDYWLEEDRISNGVYVDDEVPEIRSRQALQSERRASLGSRAADIDKRFGPLSATFRKFVRRLESPTGAEDEARLRWEDVADELEQLQPKADCDFLTVEQFKILTGWQGATTLSNRRRERPLPMEPKLDCLPFAVWREWAIGFPQLAEQFPRTYDEALSMLKAKQS